MKEIWSRFRAKEIQKFTLRKSSQKKWPLGNRKPTNLHKFRWLSEVEIRSKCSKLLKESDKCSNFSTVSKELKDIRQQIRETLFGEFTN